ncbi:hypothetical protein H9L05_21560 (plasmid) [Hymenobacter qilianensis]|uniref:Uncharacterized protein n=1 Tax=Hymenobacter qilianensis TaxID=1385715 RepID=A0A7H0H145_9BACT|nr:hypothetical protein [Hymenobacter qilianensis]QNP54261.1 hypothetical protein H9L05_21560 [Hymenobacter qilianensis]
MGLRFRVGSQGAWALLGTGVGFALQASFLLPYTALGPKTVPDARPAAAASPANRVAYLEHPAVPSLHTRLRLPDGRWINFHGVHPPAPCVAVAFFRSRPLKIRVDSTAP